MSSRSVLNRGWLLAGALGLAIAAAYLPALRGEFLWDDDAHISANPTVVGPLGLKEIWTSGRANYFPLVLTSFRLQHAFWGLNPVGYHIVTLACHVIAALLLWRVMLALRVPGAWLGAALWALHPVQVESVAWICELKNTQSAVFFLAAVLFWLRWLEGRPVVDPPSPPVPDGKGGAQRRSPFNSGDYRFYVLALLGAVLAVLSKSSTVMLPVVLALCTWWRRGRIVARDLVALTPLFAISAVAAGWTIWEQAFRQHASGGEWELPFAGRLIVAGRALWFYLFKLGWPADLAFIYPRWRIEVGSVSHYLPAFLAAAALLALTWRAVRWRWAFCATACFVALLFPVLGFFNVYFFRFSFVGDHFQYLASMVPLAVVGAWVARLPRGVSLAVGTGLVGALAVLTRIQCADYHDSESLWRATLARNPAAWMAWDNLGETLAKQGRHAEAVTSYQRALAINPADADAHHNLGFAALVARNAPEALSQFQHALALKPGDARTQNGYGFALALSGRSAEAVPYYERALEIVPDFALARRNLATALTELGRPADAVVHYERLLAAAPDDALVHRDLADALSELGRWSDAATHYAVVLRLAAPTADTQARWGIALAQAGRKDEGLAALLRAAQLDPKDGDIHRNIGLLLRELGRTGEAAEHFARATALGVPAR